jgi:NADH dehydrogenase FAD-containing subunit
VISPGDISVTLVHSGDQILPELSAELRDFAQQKMQQAGVSVVLPVVTNAEDRRVVRCVRTETMMHMVLQELEHLAQART